MDDWKYPQNYPLEWTLGHCEAGEFAEGVTGCGGVGVIGLGCEKVVWIVRMVCTACCSGWVAHGQF